MARVTGTVHVYDAAGDVTVLYAGDSIPKWAAAQVTNPKLLDTADQPDDLDDEDDAAGQGDDEQPDAPPRGGPGSGVEAWAEYAEAIGVEFPEGANRDEIIAAVDAAS